MKKIISFLLTLILLSSLSSCSNQSSKSLSDSSTNSGSITLTVNWPSKEKSKILSSAYSLKVNICTEILDANSTTVYERVVNASIIRHTSTNTTENTTIKGIPVGKRAVIIQAYNSSGTEIEYGITTTTIKAGENDSITISLIIGTFGYEITGTGDEAVPTGDSGSTTTTRYIFVNNYASNSISVINQSTDTVIGTISGIPYPSKGVFNHNGTAYYVLSNTLTNPSNPRIYKVTPNTSNWSESSVEQLSISEFFLPHTNIVKEISYELAGTGEYIWVGVKYNTPYNAYLLRINVNDTSDIQAGADLNSEGDEEFICLYRPQGMIDGKIIALFDKTIPGYQPGLEAAVCYVEGHLIKPEPLLPDTSTHIGPASNGIQGAGINTLGVALSSDQTIAFIPSKWSLNKVTYNESDNTINPPISYTSSFQDVLNYINIRGTIYGINATSLRYTTDYNTWTNAGSDFGSGLADMITSTDNSKIYITSFNGNCVYVKTISDLSRDPATITVGTNPLGISLMP